MSEIDDRVVILEFNNGQFESGVKESLSTLEKLKKSLNFEDSSKGLKELQATGQRFSLSNVVDNIQTVADRFSLLGVIGDQVMRRLTNTAFDFGKNLLLAIPNQIVSGGKRRAQNIEHAQFMMKGLLKDAYDWAVISEDLDYAVSGTAYGLDEAASAAAQLSASSVQFGDDMKAALRGISGTAAMTGESYDVIANIFTKIAGQGKIMTQELNQFAAHGINVAATLAEVMGTTEENIRALVHEGQIGFYDFAYAMDEAFGEHAKRANETFSGAFANVKAALSRMGAQFATPTYENLRRVFVALIPVLKDVEKAIKPISAAYTELAELVSGSVAESLENLHGQLTGEWPVETVAEMMWDDLKTLNQISNNRRKQEKSTFSEIYNDIRKAADDYKKDVENLHDIQERIKNDVREDKKHVGIMTDEMSDALMAESPEEYMKNFNEAVDNNLLKVMKLAKTYSRRGDDMETVSLQVANAIGYITNQAEHLNDDFLELGNSEERSAVKFDGLMDSANESMEEVKDTYRDISLMSAFNGANPFEKVMQPLLNYDAALEQNMKNYEARMEELRNTVDDYTFAEISGFEYMPTNLDVLADIGEKGYTEIAKIEKDLIDQGYDYRDVQKAKQEVLVPYNNLLMDTAASLGVQNEEETKEQKIARKKKEMYDKMSKTVSKFGHGLMQAIGLEKTEAQLNAEDYKNNEKYKQMIDDILMGKYKNAPERWELLKKETGLYSIWQNGVNESVGCEKRHQVSLEDEAAFMKYLGIETEKAAEQQVVINGVFKKLTSILTGVASAFNIIKTVGGALWKEIVQPFLAWGVPRVLNAILAPLAWIGDRLSTIWATIDVMGEGALGDIFASFREDVAAFWASVQQLEGVKLLTEVWENFKTTLGEIADGAITKIMDAFTAFGESLDEGDSEFLLTIIDGLATGLATLIGWLTDGVVAVADFFSPFFDWLLMLPVTLQAFWAEVGGFEGLQAFFKPLIDWFNGVIDTVKDFWKALFGGENEETGEQVEGFFTPVIAWFENLQTRIDNFITQAKQFTNIKDLFDWFIAKVQNKIKNFWDSIWGKKDGEETAEGAFTIGNAFEWLKGKISAFMDLFEPLRAAKQWLKDFWKALFGGKDAETGEEVGGYLSPVVDWFNGVIESVKDFWRVLFGGENKETGEQVEGFFSPIITWFTNLQTRFDSFIAQAKQFTNIKDLFDWFIGKVQTKISNFWNSLWGKKDGEEAAEGAFTIGGAFEWLKGKISAFMDSIAPLKAIKDWFAGIFNENLVKSIQDIGAAIGDFFSKLFGKQEGEEAQDNLGSFSDRFITGAQELGTRLSEIFGENSSLGKLLAGGGIGIGLVTLLKLIGAFNGSKNKDDGGIAGVLFGSAKGGMSAPKIVAALLAIGAALNLFGKNVNETGGEVKATGDIFVDTWNNIKAGIAAIMSNIQNGNVFGSIYDFIFGSSEGENGEAEGLLDKAKNAIKWVFDRIGEFISGLMGGGEGIGLGNAAAIFGTAGSLLAIISVFKLIAKAVMLFGGLFKNGLTLLVDLKQTLWAYQTEIYSNIILKIAYAIGIFAAAIVAMSFIPAEKLDQVSGILLTALLIISAAVIAIVWINRKAEAMRTGATAINMFVTQLRMAFGGAALLVGAGILFAGLAAAIISIVYAINALVKVADTSAIDKAVEVLKDIMATMIEFVMCLSILGVLGGFVSTGAGATLVGLAIVIMVFMSMLKQLESINIDEGKLYNIVGAIGGILVALGAMSYMAGASGASVMALGASLIFLSVGMLVFVQACKALTAIQWGEIGVGLVALGLILLEFGVLSKALNKVRLAALGTTLIGFSIGIIILTGALIILGNNVNQAAAGIGLLAGALAVLLLWIGIMGALHLDILLVNMSFSMIQVAGAAILLGLALPFLSSGLEEFGKLWIESTGNMLAGSVALIAIVGLIARVSAWAGPHVLMLGAGIAALAVGLGILIGMTTGFDKFTAVFTKMGDKAKELTGGVFGATKKSLDGLSKSAKDFTSSVFSGSDKAPDYTSALENYHVALGEMDFLDESVKTQLEIKMAELKELDGSEYSIGLNNVLGFIRNLDLDEGQTARVLEETARTAEEQQKEEFTLVIHKIKLLLDEHGVSEEDQDKIREELGKLAQLKRGEISVIVDNVHYLINSNPNVTEEGKEAIRTAFDEVVASQINYNAAVRDLKLYLTENTSLTVEGMDKVQEQLDKMDSREEFNTNIAKIFAFLDEADVEISDQEILMNKMRDALEAKEAVDTKVGMLNAIVGDVVVGEDAQADLKTKINTALNNLTAALETEGEEDDAVAYATISNLKAEIDDADEATISEEGKKKLKKLIEDAVGAIKDYHVTVEALEAEVLKILPDEKRTAFKELWNALINSDTYNEAEVEKLWVTCNDLGMTDKEIKELLKKLGVVLDEGLNKVFALRNLHFVMDAKGLDETTQNSIEEEILTLMGLDPDKDAEEYELQRQVVVKMMTEAGFEDDEITALINEYTGEAEDTKTAKVSLLSVLVENATFATEAEKDKYLTQVNKMLTEYGSGLSAAIAAFKKGIMEESSLTNGEKTIIGGLADEINSLLDSGYSELYEAQLEWEEKMRRKSYVGAYLVDTTGKHLVDGERGMINEGSVIAKEFAAFFKDFDGEITTEQMDAFAEHVAEMGYTWEEIVGSFSNVINPITGEIFDSDKALQEYLYHRGTAKPLSAPLLRELMMPFAKSFSDGSSKALQEDLDRYGKLNWGEALEHYGEYVELPGSQGAAKFSEVTEALDENLLFIEDAIKEDRISKATSEYYDLVNEKFKELAANEPVGPLTAQRTAELRQQVYEEIGTLEEYVNGLDKKPILFEELYDYLFGENEHWNEYIAMRDDPLFAYMQKIHEDALASEDEAEYIAQLSGRINATLYKTGSGIVYTAVEVTDDIRAAYEALTEEQKEQIRNLKGLFDPDNVYESDWDFYAFLQKAFGGLFGAQGEEFNIDEALGMEGGLTNYLLDRLTDSMVNGNLSAHQLALLYKQFPDLRELVQNYFLQNDKPLPEGFQHDLDREMNEYYQAMNEALEKARSSDQSTAKQGQQELHDIFTSGEVDESTIKQWLSESPEFSGILEKYAKDGIGDIDVDSITSDLFGQLSTNTSLGGTFGDWLGGNFGDWFSNLKFGLPSDQVSKAGETIGNQVLDAADAATKTIGTDTGKNLDEALGTSLVDNAGAATAGMTAVTTLLKGAGEDDLGIASPSRWAIGIGEFIIEGLVYALEKGQSRPSRVFREIVRDCTDKIRAMAVELFHGGVEITMRLAEGIVSEVQAVYSAMGSLIDDAAEGARSKEYVAEELGQYFGEGYVRGIDSMRQAAYEAGGALAAEAEQGNRDRSGTESPSRVARSLGNFFGMGYVNGMMEFSKKVHDTAGDLATTAINTLRNPMQLVQSLLDSDLESDPTITPVMDLSNIQNGVRRINGMMPDTGINLGYISSSMNRVKTTNEDVVAAISGLSRQMGESAGGNVYNVNGVTYDDGSNIATAVQDLVRAARVERRR